MTRTITFQSKKWNELCWVDVFSFILIAIVYFITLDMLIGLITFFWFIRTTTKVEIVK